MNWFIVPLNKIVDFKGRASRTEFWLFFLFFELSNAIFSFIISLLSLFYENDQLYAIMLTILGVMVILSVALFAAGVRRIHDGGNSGWWILFPLVHFVLLVIDSQPGNNKYGPNPKGIADPSTPINDISMEPTIPTVNPSAADSIRELAKLRDEGILSTEEFDAKKAELLGKI